MLVAALWGLAEATLFVVVADVWIGFVALERGWKAGAKAALAASLGAALGGLVMMVWARGDAEGVHAVLTALPAIDAAMVARIEGAYASGGLLAALAGAFAGIPYKLFADAAGASGASIPLFVLATPLLRLPRFLLVAAIAALAGRRLGGWMGRRAPRTLYAAVWLCFYAGYFSVMPG